MTLLLVVLLVLLWGAVIVPALINHHNNRAGPDSFRRGLEALSTGRRAPSRSRRGSTPGSAGRWIMGPPPSRARPRPAPRSGSASGQRRPAPMFSAVGPRGYRSSGPAGPTGFRSEWAGLDPAIEKRRHVFIGLVIGVVVTLLFGFIPGLGILLKLNIVLDVALVGYVVYLVMTRPQPLPRGFAEAGFDDMGEPHPEEERWLQAGEL
ncbi:MAG TPA: hypothetical protein VHA57_08920 [Actinomycetota bacterium]|nr:hypothetical protein [Actinomycetota bacterium]